MIPVIVDKSVRLPPQASFDQEQFSEFQEAVDFLFILTFVFW